MNEDKRSLPMFLYFTHMIYKYYYRLGFSQSNTMRKKKVIKDEIFNNITHFIKNSILKKFLQDGFFYVQS